MKNTGKLITSSNGRKATVVMDLICALIFLVFIFLFIDEMAEYKDKNYYGRYDDEISKLKWGLILFGAAMLSLIIKASVVAGQRIMVYEKFVYGVARNTTFSNRTVEIPYEDIHGVDSNSARIMIYTRTGEIIFCVDESEYIATIIRGRVNECDRKNSPKRGDEDHVVEKGEESEMLPSCNEGYEDEERGVAYFRNCYSEYIVCPYCNTKQSSENDFCEKCNVEFVFEFDT